MTRDDSSACYDWFPQLLKKKKKKELDAGIP